MTDTKNNTNPPAPPVPPAPVVKTSPKPLRRGNRRHGNVVHPPHKHGKK